MNASAPTRAGHGHISRTVALAVVLVIALLTAMGGVAEAQANRGDAENAEVRPRRVI